MWEALYFFFFFFIFSGLWCVFCEIWKVNLFFQGLTDFPIFTPFPWKRNNFLSFLVLALLLWRMDHEENGVYATTLADKLSITLSILWFVQWQRKGELENWCVYKLCLIFVFGMAFSSLSVRHRGAASATFLAGGVRQVRYSCAFLCSLCSLFSSSLAL